MRPAKSILAFAILALLSACASGPGLKRYPRQYIERPLTLPQDVASYDVSGEMGYSLNDQQTRVSSQIPTPLRFRTAMSDSVTLRWFGVIPYALDWKAYEDEQTQHALSFWFADPNRGLLMPGLAWQVRHLIDDESAIELKFSLPSSTVPEFSVGEIYQVSRELALKPELILQQRQIDGVNYSAVPVRLNIYWSFDREWDFTGTYTYSRLGLPSSFFENVFGFSFTRYW